MHATLDASVIVKWYIATPDEQDAGQALALLEGIENNVITLVQPPHALAEIAAVLARELPDQASDYFPELSRIFAVSAISHGTGVYQRAIALARQHNHHLFDTLYHATALEEDTTLITADRRYYDKAKLSGHIMMLEDFNGGIV